MKETFWLKAAIAFFAIVIVMLFNPNLFGLFVTFGIIIIAIAGYRFEKKFKKGKLYETK